MWYGAFEESALESVELPPSLKRIEYRTFCNCRSLRNVALPGRLEFIGQLCFLGCALEKITLPSALKEVQQNVFSDCAWLRAIHVEEGCDASLSSAGLSS